MVVSVSQAVSAVPSPKFHLKRGFTPLVAAEVKVTLAPTACGIPLGASSARPAVTSHAKVISAGVLVPSVTVMTGAKLPAVVTVPVMTPDAGEMDRPGGNPFALKVTLAPSGSMA